MAEHETLPVTVPWSREVVEEIADDIGDAVLAHVQIMYPSAIQATPSTFKISLRNCMRNEILAAVGINDAGQAIARIHERKLVRRQTRADYRRMRSARASPQDVQDED
jgi:hypothetical protein